MAGSNELSVVAEAASLRWSHLWDGAEAPPGEGRAVVLVPGFAIPGSSLAPLARWLRWGGWRTAVVPLGFNVDCGERAVGRVVDVLEQGAAQTGAPVAVIGHSRGGQLARVATVRRPELVSSLITVATPWTVGPPDRPGVEAVARAVRIARRGGFRGWASIDCARGACCSRFRTDLRRVPEPPWTAIWSSTDGIAGDDAQPPAEAPVTVDIRTSHTGAVLSVAGWRAIAAALTPPV